MRVAIIFGERISNIIEVPSIEIAKALHPGADAVSVQNIGWGWVKEGNTWVAPKDAVPALEGK